MIRLKYREQLPPYWYENTVAEYHFEGAGSEMEHQVEAINELSKQMLLPYATYSLDVWDWIYYGEAQRGTDQKRRESIRKKYLMKAKFTMPTLWDMGRIAGKLLQVTEDFAAKEIEFRFSGYDPVNLTELQDMFEAIRPVHVNRERITLQKPGALEHKLGNLYVLENMPRYCGAFYAGGENILC